MTTPNARLSPETLSSLRGGQVSPPPTERGTWGTGIVHLGIGAFHRAHQASYTQDAAVLTGDDRWGSWG